MKQSSCQESFLNVLRKGKVSVTIFLSSGIKLQGIITSYDSFAIVLKRDAHMQLIYKHSISTIMPNGMVNFKDDSDDETPVKKD